MPYDPNNLYKVLWPIENVPQVSGTFSDSDRFMWALGYIAFYAARMEDTMKFSLRQIFEEYNEDFYLRFIKAKSLNELLKLYKKVCFYFFDTQRKELESLFYKAQNAAKSRNIWLHTPMALRASTGELVFASTDLKEVKNVDTQDLVSLAKSLCELGMQFSLITSQITRAYNTGDEKDKLEFRDFIIKEHTTKKPDR